MKFPMKLKGTIALLAPPAIYSVHDLSNSYERDNFPILINFVRTASYENLTLKVLKMKIAGFANRVDPDEVAHHEPPHQDLRCMPSIL